MIVCPWIGGATETGYGPVATWCVSEVTTTGAAKILFVKIFAKQLILNFLIKTYQKWFIYLLNKLRINLLFWFNYLDGTIIWYLTTKKFIIVAMNFLFTQQKN